MPSLLVAIANYDFSENADTLKAKLSPNFPVVLIDATSPRPPKTTDISIRSTQQLAQKAILGWMANVAHFKTTTPACGFHWGDLYNRALDLSDTDLLHEAYNYGERPGTTAHDLMPAALHLHGPAQLSSAGTLDHKQLLHLVCRSWEASLLS